jgi:8-oxo-dGTP diphosphatase
MERAEGEALVSGAGRKAGITAAGERLLAAFHAHRTSAQEQLGHRFRNPILTVDGIAMLEGRLVLVRRGKGPHLGQLALPGGIVEYGETVEAAVAREVQEETGLVTRASRLLGVYSDPERDPRGHFVTIAFVLEVMGGGLRAGDDAAGVELAALDRLPNLAFDHRLIVQDFIDSLRSCLPLPPTND